MAGRMPRAAGRRRGAGGGRAPAELALRLARPRVRQLLRARRRIMGPSAAALPWSAHATAAGTLCCTGRRGGDVLSKL